MRLDGSGSFLPARERAPTLLIFYQVTTRPTSLLAPSSLLSSRWSKDNLLTPDPKRLYSGTRLHTVSLETLQVCLEQLAARRQSMSVTSGGLGVLSWNVRYEDSTGSNLLLVPLCVDEPGVGGRSLGTVPARCDQHEKLLSGLGLTRYLLPSRGQIAFSSELIGARFAVPDGYRALTYSLGSARVDVEEDGEDFIHVLSFAATCHITTEIIAALSYFYDDKLDGGTCISDIVINDGDFLVKTGADGRFELKLVCARRLESNISTTRFLVYLMQLTAYEDFSCGDDLIGLPVPIGDPLAVMRGFVRGRVLRARDLGLDEQHAKAEARRFLFEFSLSRSGRGYRPWVRDFLDERLGEIEDPRKPWWNLVELEQRRNLLQLTGKFEQARPLSKLLDQLTQAIGSTAQLSRDEEESTFEHRFLAVDDGSAKILEQLPKKRRGQYLANPEIFGGLRLDRSVQAAAVQKLPSFENFMDDALHHPDWGYYTHQVSIGDRGHFTTNPERLSPHYGRWLARWAQGVWSDLCSSGTLAESARFSVVEFGAGNGRLARDFLDAVFELGQTHEEFERFSACLRYRIYELSPSLRTAQKRLLGDDADVVPGDARHPAQSLRGDFPNGLVGLVLSNELPDAFGVHKVLLGTQTRPQAVLVVPRVDLELLMEGFDDLLPTIERGDRELREDLNLERRTEEAYLSRTGWNAVMSRLHRLESSARDAAVDRIWFDEVLVDAQVIEPLAVALSQGAKYYAEALAKEDSSVVAYVNTHAIGYIEELATVLKHGQILTIDYGDTTWDLVQGARLGKHLFRIYRDEGAFHPHPNHPYTAPGHQDLTADVNFTDLTLAGQRGGLELAYFGPERAICNNELGELLRSPRQAWTDEFLGSDVFKVLALARNCSFAPDLSQFPLRSVLTPETQTDFERREASDRICSLLTGKY